jgi:hypothetical protein
MMFRSNTQMERPLPMPSTAKQVRQRFDGAGQDQPIFPGRNGAERVKRNFRPILRAMSSWVGRWPGPWSGGWSAQSAVLFVLVLAAVAGMAFAVTQAGYWDNTTGRDTAASP